jgi:hypothetical protein
MHHEDDTPLSDEELALAKKGEALIAAAVADTQAPQSLREAVERDRERARAAPKASFWRRHRRALAAMATTTATLAVIGVALQPGSKNTAPSLAAVEAAARLDATQPAPAPNGGDPPILAARVGAISFPDWRKSFGWRAVGSREDSLSGRTVRTVFYRNPDRARLGYAVVAGAPLREHPPGREVTRAGNAYNVARAGGHTLVTWTQQGHTCAIVASSTVPEARLVDLAASRNS